MAPLDVDSQFKFLIACIKHSTAGKVDFNEVAKECEIISKGAAAKRYERLMKAHGISASGGVKKEKEPKDSKDGIKRPSKKRKLAAVDEEAGDVDEPIKAEVKGEVKTEDSIAVKAEQENAGGGATAAVPTVASTNEATPMAATVQPSISPSTNAQNDEDDDEVLVISATEKRDDGYGSVYSNGGHHHSHTHSHSHSPAPMIPGIHSFDYAANIGFPPQMSTPTRIASPNTLPFGFPPNAWMYPHDAHGYL
ncbi:hypothetical protein F5Y05DRAFT_411898 [Hypoxylon sp. FL0543]|nr:hypothetical protein F5Y05DRAFT_411898 [Hypoxylon sp. FL0543]